MNVCGAPGRRSSVGAKRAYSQSRNQQVVLSWTASLGATSYQRQRSTTEWWTVIPTSGAHRGHLTNTGLTDGTHISMWFLFELRRRESQLSLSLATPAFLPADVTITIDPTKTHPISPWIYGINHSQAFQSSAQPTLNRLGAIVGQPTMGNNASNAGSDFGRK